MICYGFGILIVVGLCYGFCSAEVGGVIEKLDSGGGGCGWLWVVDKVREIEIRERDRKSVV